MSEEKKMKLELRKEGREDTKKVEKEEVEKEKEEERLEQ